MYYFFDVLKQKLSQKSIPEIGVEMIPIVISPLYAKRVANKFMLYKTSLG